MIVKSNPFPSDTVVKDSIDELPDFRETESYRTAVGMVENFIEEFPLPTSAGLAMGIRGRFGSGKTHLIFQLMRELTAVKGGQCKPIYAKPDKVDFLDVYINYFARKFEAADLKRVVSLHLARLLRMRSGPATDQSANQSVPTNAETSASGPVTDTKTLAQIAQEEVDQLVRTDPQGVLALVEGDLLPVSGLSRDFDQEIESTERKQTVSLDDAGAEIVTDAASNVSLDFFRAYSKLTDPNLGPLAVRWIQGGQLTNSELVDLGLKSSGITQPSLAMEAMRFLLAAFKKADYTVVFCLDEFERFSSRGTDVNACAALLKDLAEIFQKTGHLLIVSGVEDAWRAMPPDVFARIKPADIVQMNLSEEEARGLIDVYCKASRTSVESLFKKDKKEDAFHLAYEASNYNTRRILDLCHKSYEIAARAGTSDGEPAGTVKIEEADVERAANQVLSTAKRQDAVGAIIRTVASDSGMAVQSDFSVEGLRCDYLLGDAQSPQLAVEVTQSIFKLGEVSAARKIAELSQQIRTTFPRTAFCVVIVGYSTKEVRDDLVKVVDRVFSFDEDRFETEFREFLKSVQLKPKEVEDRLKSQESAYQDLLGKFDELESSRRSEIEELKEALANLQETSVRARETTRERRVTDKMEETLDELDRLLDQEAEVTFVLRRRDSDPDASKETLRSVLRLLEQQYNHINRARILNERLPRAEEFLGKLRQLDNLTEDAAAEWRQSLSYPGSLSTSRKLFSERKRVVSELQGIHFSRKPAEGLGRIIEPIRQNKLVATLSFLSLIALITMVYPAYLGWNNEKVVINAFTTQLSSIQGKILIAQVQSEMPEAVKSVYAVLTDTIALESIPTTQTYIVSGITSTRVPEIRAGVVSVNNRIRSSSDELWRNGYVRDSVGVNLGEISKQCLGLQRELSEITFVRFVSTFFVYHRLSALFLLLPAFSLVVLLMRKRVQNRRALHQV